MHMTMKMMFSINIPSISRLGSPIIVIDIVLKILIELINREMIMLWKSSIDSGCFKKLRFLMKITFFENFEK